MRRSSAQNITKSEQESRTSLRSLFGGKKIFPIIAEVVYGSEQDHEKKQSDNMKPTKIRSLSMEIGIKGEKDSQKCWKKFVDVMKSGWATRNTEKIEKNSDDFFKATLRELFIYIIFLILLIIIAFGQSDMNIYGMTKRIYENFLNVNKTQQSSFQTILGMSDVQTFLTSSLLPTIFWTVWYNPPDNISTFDNNLIYMDDKIVGVVRLRLLKSKENTCSIPSLFKNDILNCYDQYAIKDSNRSTFGLGNDTAWIYQTIPGGHEYTGDISTYESGGFVQLLTKDYDSSNNIVQYLFNNKWLDHTARVLFIDFTIYNSNVDLFSIVKLVIEFPSTGGAFPKIELRTLKLLRYVNTFDYFILCCEVLFTIFIFYYILEEIAQICRHRIKYLFDLWNIIDIFLVIISLSCIMINVYRFILVNSKLDSLFQSEVLHPNFDFASYWQKIYNEAICINVFLAWLKVYKYISFNKTMTTFTATLSRSSKDLVGFTIMFCIVFFAYSQLAYFLFSSKLQDYRRIETSVFALFRIMLGDFTFYDFYNSNNILGPIFFVTYIFFIFFILMSMFFAIINETFIEVKNEIDKIKDQYHIASFLKRQILSHLRKDKIIKIQEVLEKGDLMHLEELNFHDWRRELLKHGYAEVEIQALFMKYDRDGDRVLDYDERKQMLQDIKERRLNLTETLTNEDVPATDNTNEKEFVTRELMDDLTNRINKAENGLMEILQKIDQVLQFLAKSEQAKLTHQKDVRYTLQILTGSNSSFYQ